MPIYRLSEELIFPPAELADPSGILAVGGDLSPKRLVLAYSSGIFPWYNEDDPIIWHSPDPRFVLPPSELHVPKRLNRCLKCRPFSFSFDRAFDDVIDACSAPRAKQKETWILPEIKDAYRELHHLGLAHSVESWKDGELVGGLYGVSLGSMFFGESMFSRTENASKAALLFLIDELVPRGLEMIDSQVYTAHLAAMGARDIPRSEYLEILEHAVTKPTLQGNWGELFNRP